MFKLIILVIVLALVASEENDWFQGRWLQVVSYPESTIPVPCEWYEVSLALTTKCVCANKTIPLEASILLKQTHARTFPVIMFEDMDELQETLEQKCKYHNGYEENPVVFRKINENYMVAYAKHNSRMSKEPEPNQALLLVKEVPKLSELRKVMSEIEDLSNRTYTINCERFKSK